MTFFIIIQLNSEWDENKFNSNQMEDQIGAVPHWSHQKEHKQAKSKNEKAMMKDEAKNKQKA